MAHDQTDHATTDLSLSKHGFWYKYRRKTTTVLWVRLISAAVGTLFLVLLLSFLISTNQHPVVLSQPEQGVSQVGSVPPRLASSLSKENIPLLAFSGALPSTEHPLVPQEFSDCELLDFECYFKEALTAFGNLLYENVKPLLNSMVEHQDNFLTQTPAKLTYDHFLIGRVAKWSLSVVDLSLLVLVAFAGYQIMLGRAVGWQTADATTLLPRILVAVILAHSWELLCGLLIDFSNMLSLGVIDLLHTAFLAEVVASLKTLGPPDPTDGPVPIGGTTALFFTIVLALFLIIQLLLLIWQMLVRLALIMILVALSPLGLGCLASPLTEHWGHLWISLFVHTVMVQFLQVTALALAGMLSLVIVNEDIFAFDQALALQLVSTAMFYLVLRLPAMLSAYMPSPLVQAGVATGNAIGGAVKRAAATL